MVDLYANMVKEPEKPRVKTLFVNLIMGPGAGKSTVSTGVFSKLKRAGVNAEYVSEFAKDKTWESEDHLALQCQPYITGKQFFRQFRVDGQVDVAVTDTSLLLALVYETFGSTPSYQKAVVEQYNLFRNLPILLTRNPDRPYNPRGRRQTKEQAEALDKKIVETIDGLQIPYLKFEMTDDDAVEHEIVTAITNHIERVNNAVERFSQKA